MLLSFYCRAPFDLCESVKKHHLLHLLILLYYAKMAAVEKVCWQLFYVQNVWFYSSVHKHPLWTKRLLGYAL